MKPLAGPELLPALPLKSVVIFLHGLGSNGDDLLSLAPFFAHALPDTAFLAPHAPLVTPFAANGFQWFEYWDRGAAQIKAGLDATGPLLMNYVAAIAMRFGIGHDKIILCGFSQGTMTALYTGVGITPPLAGIIGFSGALLDPDNLVTTTAGPPVLLVHGLRDDVVPAQASAKAQVDLTSRGYPTKYLPIPNLGHSIDQTGISEAVRFCVTQFNNER